MDIDMDMDIDCVEDLGDQMFESSQAQEIDIYSDQTELKPILDTPNDTSIANYLDPVSNKIYLRGLENLTTNDIYTYVATYYNSHKISQVEWIDDLSANLVFPSSEIALNALKSLSTDKSCDFKSIPVLQTTKAKSFPQHPEVSLEIRLAVAGDKKQVGARERSRFYLLNPEYDPALGSKRTNSKVTKIYKYKNEGGHRVQKHDAREQQRRDRKIDSDSKLYDRANLSLLNQARATRRGHRRDSSLISEARERDLRDKCSKKIGKELFPDHEDSNRGRLRNQGILPTQDDHDMQKETPSSANTTASYLVKSSNNHKAKEMSRNNNTKELFPPTQSKQRLGILGETDQSIDLIPMSSVVRVRKASDYHQQDSNYGLSLNSRRKIADNSKEISIRGLAKDFSPTTNGFAIKGASSGLRINELFPSSKSSNDRRDLFDRKTDVRPHRQKMVKDLFL